MELLTGFLSQILSSAGVIFLFGFIISLLRRAFCAIAGKSGPKILLFTGIIGTPIHELSHAVMCVIFGHRIREIKLFCPLSHDGSLGHVAHSYNKKNIYHQIGNFFIGTAPVALSSGIIVLLMLILLPDAFSYTENAISSLSFTDDISSVPISELFDFISGSFAAIFSLENFSSWRGWVFIILSIMISTHMEMSGSDIKSGLLGLLYITLVLFLIDGALYVIFPSAFFTLNDAAFSFGMMLSSLLSVPVLFLSLLIAVALMLRCLGALFKK